MSTGSTQTLAKTRAAISELQRQLASLDDARVPRDVAVARIDAFLQDLADWQHGQMLVDSFTQQEHSPAFLLDARLDMPRQVEHLIAWANAATLRKVLIAGVDAVYADLGADEAMSAADITKHKAKIESELYELEVHEERLVVEAETSGYPVTRRIGANPRAILAA